MWGASWSAAWVKGWGAGNDGAPQPHVYTTPQLIRLPLRLKTRREIEFEEDEALKRTEERRLAAVKRAHLAASRAADLAQRRRQKALRLLLLSA